MRGHVDAESLALCAEGLLSRRRSDRIRSHVASCSQCAATQARLTEVPALLAQVPSPSLPPGIAARLDAALSAEEARRAAREPGTVPHAEPAQHPGAAPAPRTGMPPAGRPRGPRLRLPVMARVLAATAGVLVIAGGVGYAVSQSSSTSSSSGSGESGSATAPQSTARAGPQLRSPSDIAPGGQAGGAQLTVRHSGTRYGKDTFAEQAAALLGTGTSPPAGLNQPGKASGGLAQHAPAESAVTQCVDKVVSPGVVRAGEVKLVDQARYQGRPATVIVVRVAPAQTGTVYVARCSAARADILAEGPLPSG